jgi:immune inhibitor A
MSEIQAYLKSFDKQDRYDSNGNGNFDEPDGFIDHFQIVHAGGDQAAGDPFQGTDAIWSHRWYAALFGGGPNGFPGFNAGSGGASGGLPGGLPNNPTGVWVGDYTIQPENGGLGVFAHEYAHDLGLPDLYDTSGNTGGAENNTGFWSLMSSGANIGDGDVINGPNGIGDAPTDLGAWEKFQLGWLSPQGGNGHPFYDVARAGRTSVHKLGDNDEASKQAQALFVVLPDKKRIDNIGAPKTGAFAFYSSMGDDIETTMTKTVSGGGALTAQVNYEIEEHFDYAFLEANVGGTWTSIVTNLSSPASEDQSGLNPSGAGIDGSSAGAYVALTANVPAGATAVRFRYVTDGGVAPKGILIDDIVLAGVAIGTAETDAEGWTFDGFRRTTGTEESFHFNAYVAENRQYDDYDTSLATAYNFGFLDTLADKVEHFPYQNGLLVSYWDNSFGDNNVGDHPGGGLILPVDAHPTFAHHPDGHLVRPRIMSFDSTFGLEATDEIVINKNTQPITIASQPAAPVFDDSKTYWFNSDEHAATGAHVGRYQPGWFGVNVPKTGTKIRVVNEATGAQGAYMQVEVNGR